MKSNLKAEIRLPCNLNLWTENKEWEDPQKIHSILEIVVKPLI